MSILTHVFSVTGTIFAIIILGYICTVTGVFTKDALQALSRFVVNLALPALIFDALSSQRISALLDLGYLGGYLMGSLSVLILVYRLAGVLGSTSPTARTFDATGAACANSGFIGYPILLLAMPAIAPTALAMNMLVENLVIIPLVIVMAELSMGKGSRALAISQTLLRLVTNPIIIAMGMGVVFAGFNLELPTPANSAVELLAASSSALSLFVIGGTLAKLSLSKVIQKRVVMIVIGKLIGLPLAVWAGMSIMGALGAGVENPDLRNAAIVLAATPSMTLYPLLAQQYGQEETAATAMLAMTVLSFFTISGLLYIL